MSQGGTPTTLVFNEATHRYRLDKKSIRGVTGLIKGGTEKAALVQWAANVVAGIVADHPNDVEEMRRQGRDFLYNQLRFAPNNQRDEAGVRGHEVHALADPIMHGHEVDVPDRLMPWVQGYVEFLEKWQPQPVFTEAPVAHRKHWYAGTADSLVTVEGEVWLWDWKTSRGVYGDTCMQAAAYARAEFYVKDGIEIPMPHVDRIGVVHLTPTGSHLYDLGDIDLAFEEFLHVSATTKSADRRKRLISEPLERVA